MCNEDGSICKSQGLCPSGAPLNLSAEAIPTSVAPILRTTSLVSSDPACNPYLTFSVMLAAGLEGIEKKYEAPDPIEENVYEMTEEERQERGIDTLPASLQEAIMLTEKSELVRKALGDHVFKAFIKNKKIEWDMYRTQVTEFELKRYLPIL